MCSNKICVYLSCCLLSSNFYGYIANILIRKWMLTKLAGSSFADGFCEINFKIKYKYTVVNTFVLWLGNLITVVSGI